MERRQSPGVQREPASTVPGVWRDGWRRVGAAPAIAAGVFALTFVLAWPLALTMRGIIERHLGGSIVAEEAAEAVSYDWWQEFAAQASGFGATFTPTIVGFAATLDGISSVLDGRRQIVPIAAALGLYLAAWAFVTGGILDRYARQRPTRAFGFFAASGVYFFRLMRLAIVAGAVYWWLFAYVRTWLFEEWLPDLTRDLAVERSAFLWRAAFYAVFGSLLLLANVAFDYAKVRLVVEDRRSVLGALTAAIRFISRNAARVFGLYAVNGVVFLVVLAVWAIAAPGVRGGALSLWTGFAIGQLYVLARLLLKLQFLASQAALFQSRLAHATYTAAPEPAWPESPTAETIVSVSRP